MGDASARGKASRRKGSNGERTVVNWLKANEWDAKRRLAGNGQAGDIHVEDAPRVVLEVKTAAVPDLKTWYLQLVNEAYGETRAAIIWKLPRKTNPDDWVVFALDVQVPTVNPIAANVPVTPEGIRDIVGWLRIQPKDELVIKDLPLVAMTGKKWRVEILPLWRGN